MRHVFLASATLVLAVAVTSALAQQSSSPDGHPLVLAQATPPQPSPAGPYKAVVVTPPKPMGDASFDAFRKDLGDIAKKKDRTALASHIVAKGFFWQREDSNGADPKKSGIDNFAAAIGLDAKDGGGWETLAAFAAEPTAEAVADMKGVICGPAAPIFNEKDLEAVLQATKTDVSEWAYPSAAGLDVRDKPAATATSIEKLAVILVRLFPEEQQGAAPSAPAADWIRIVVPSGKTGYVPISSLVPLVSDQLCYLKDTSGWHIAGFFGGAGGEQ